MKKRDLFSSDSDELEKFTVKMQKVVRDSMFNDSPELLSKKINDTYREFHYIENRRLLRLITHGILISTKEIILLEIREKLNEK